MDVPDGLVFNYLIELKRKDIHPVDRAKIIKTYCDKNKLSMRALAKELGMPHSTLQDWMDYSRIEKKTFSNLIEAGMDKKTIHKILRENRDKPTISTITGNKLNLLLSESAANLRVYINKPTPDEYTPKLLQDLRNIINRIEIHIELKNK